MSTTNMYRTAVQGTIFLMISGGLMLYAADGKIFLTQPIGIAFLIVWSTWWVIAFSLRSRKLFPDDRNSIVIYLSVYSGVILAICFGAPWEYVHMTQPIPRDGWLSWLGIAVCILSIGLITLSMWMAGNLYGIRKNHFSSEYVLISGPYRYVRHPGYLGVILFVLGTALMLSSLIAWAAFVITVITSTINIRNDEENLAKILINSPQVFGSRPRWMLLPGIY